MNLAQIYSEMEGVYSRQHLAYMSRLKKIPGAEIVKRRWYYPETSQLRVWILTALKQKKNTAKRQRFNTSPPSKVAALRASDLARLSGLGKRQVERLALSVFKKWHYTTSGGHHRFTNAPALRLRLRHMKSGGRVQLTAGKKVKPVQRTPMQTLIHLAAEMQGCLSGWRKQKPIAQWSPDLRSQVKSQLEPIVRFYQTL